MSEKEIIELVASIEAVKDFTKDVDVIFNFINEDDSKDKKIDALENVINSAMNYVKQFVSLDEDGRFYSKELSQVGSFEKEVN